MDIIQCASEKQTNSFEKAEITRKKLMKLNYYCSYMPSAVINAEVFVYAEHNVVHVR